MGGSGSGGGKVAVAVAMASVMLVVQKGLHWHHLLGLWQCRRPLAQPRDSTSRKERAAFR